jgi:hypothetical protein
MSSTLPEIRTQPPVISLFFTPLKKTLSYKFFFCSMLRMTYFPLYPYHTDPLRILSPRRIMEQYPAGPPDPHPQGEGTNLKDGQVAPSETPDVAPRPGEAGHPEGGGGAPSKAPAAAFPKSTSIPDVAYWPNHPGSRASGPPGAATKNPSAPRRSDRADGGLAPRTAKDAEGIRLVRAWLDKHWDTVEAMARADEGLQRPPPPPPPPPDKPPPPVHVARGDRWTKPKMAEFLRHLAATHSVSEAARAVGMHRRSAYKLRARLKGQPFDIAWEAAFRHSYDNLAHAALELALEGEEVPHYYRGELKGTHRKRNTQLMMQLLRMRNRVGAPMLGRYGAAAEYWGDHWDELLQRIQTGAVDWSDEYDTLGPDKLAALGVPDADREVALIAARNAPDAPRS